VELVQNKLNNRPRKKFGYQTPNEVFLQKLNQLPKVAFMC
jgi:IS30 family transposase